MNRRVFVLAVAGMAGTVGIMMSDLSGAARPCPPPFVSLDGGTSASTVCTAGAFYTTNFPATENPLSEGGKWVNGKVVGFDWNNPLTVPGIARASINSDTGGGRYDDSIAHLSTSFMTFAANQFAQGTVYRAAGYSPSASVHHEIELLLRFQITANNARGYEVLWSIDGWICVVRWNGPVANYTELFCDQGATGPAADGDVLRAEIIAGVIKVYKNGELRVTTPPDTTWTSGQPGIGFWPVDGATKENYGWRSFTAGDL
jgi:hypothetical protein